MDTIDKPIAELTSENAPSPRLPSCLGKHPESLSARKEKLKKSEKEAMGAYFTTHDFLVAQGASAEEPREAVASVFVNQGTTVNIAVRSVLDWIRKTPTAGPFTVTWHTTSALVPATLRRAREPETNDSAIEDGKSTYNGMPDLWAATRIFLFPGDLDQSREVVYGHEAVKFDAGNAWRRVSR